MTKRKPVPPADWDAAACERAAFVAMVEREGRARWRELPWRNVDDPYAVLVSEVMLQQTQVKRVLGYWERFLAHFPTVDALAAGSTSDVLELWQGLGYNRRALALKRCCEQCARDHAGALPKTSDELEALPGIGPATAAGVVAFAYNRPAVYLETNVRSVFLHELFPEREQVPDRELVPYVADTCPATGARAWYYALLDYGAYLKTQVENPSRRSRQYTRQSAFEGSHRQKRSFVLKCVLAQPEGVSAAEVARRLNAFEREQGRGDVPASAFDRLVAELADEGFFTAEDGRLVP
ncbi:MAG: adenine glycosylase [Eggerthellaceae bacterium]|jgi:A/G-specific adenine glycosylase